MIFGGGNDTQTTHSTPETGYHIMGGIIRITGNVGDLASGIKETKGRVKQMGDTDTQGMMYTGQGTFPNHTERAYDHMSDINNAARIDTGYEMFSLKGLTTTSCAASKPAPVKPNPKN